ncbi:MAG: polysaccharide export outer membrane protein [Brevundimonas sp.]|jgi:polysaccharide export outer membrane protein|uniref:polysaccharide biosynthesis/export family protein n=1 Tax=Brevundimonas sp. GW460-12-10-14-LB2 TaxID=1827469 RepID=UPI0007BC88F7|nr:polysaccharide biosynthesis/export family protein [Brevundimonas sp. GW460-12-10-14-LB2]ANC54365.1 polysaccharide biosynthesis protein [Brevundimonas sp. GW460-12-10-14-LB2]MEA3473909.1 polysaccharide biosynthesis/export family protein [Pseudomonadota bacterium]
MTRTILPLAIVAILGGCSTLPRDGPSGASVNAGATTASALGSYALVPLTFEATERMKQVPPQFFGTLAAGSSDQPADVIGEGDTLAISIFDPSGALFGGTLGAGSSSSRTNTTLSGGNQALPGATVDRSGSVTIPFGGQVRVQGLTSTQAAAAIRRALVGKVANPQVLVSIAGNASNTVNVLGDVRQPGRAPLGVNSDRILDVIAAAGGSARTTDDLTISIQREGRTYTAPLSAVTTEFGENVRLQRGDVVNVQYKPRRFSTFGGLNAVAQVDMPAGPVTLTGALSKVGGLNTNTANARRVLIFRFERPEVAQALGINQPATPRGVPVVYELDFSDAANVFAATNMEVMPEDVIYVPLAGAAEMRKFFEVVQSLTRVVYDVSVTSTLNNN